MDNNRIEYYSKEQIDNKLTLLRTSLSKLAKKLKEVEDSGKISLTDFELFKEHIEESINALQKQIDGLKSGNPKEPNKPKKPETKDSKKYPPYIIDDDGNKRYFLKVNRTTKQPIYQVRNFKH